MKNFFKALLVGAAALGKVSYNKEDNNLGLEGSGPNLRDSYKDNSLGLKNSWPNLEDSSEYNNLETSALPPIKFKPTKTPSRKPSMVPSPIPSKFPSISPTDVPSKTPTSAPTLLPTDGLSSLPTEAPSTGPTSAPTISPSKGPTMRPTRTPTFARGAPTPKPTSKPVTQTPTSVAGFAAESIEDIADSKEPRFAAENKGDINSDSKRPGSSVKKASIRKARVEENEAMNEI